MRGSNHSACYASAILCAYACEVVHTEAHGMSFIAQAQRPQDWMSAPMRPIQSLQLAQRIEAAGPEGLPLAELRKAAEELGLDYEMVRAGLERALLVNRGGLYVKEAQKISFHRRQLYPVLCLSCACLVDMMHH